MEPARAVGGRRRRRGRRRRVGGAGQGGGRQRAADRGGRGPGAAYRAGEGGRGHPGGGPPAPLTALAKACGVTEDAIALAAALAQPWASVVLSGAVTRAQLDENLAALTVGPLPELSLAKAPEAYWAQRAARRWR